MPYVTQEPMLGRPNWLEPVLAKSLAGAWLKTSVATERTNVRSSATPGEEMTPSLTLCKQVQSITPLDVPVHRHVASPRSLSGHEFIQVQQDAGHGRPGAVLGGANRPMVAFLPEQPHDRSAFGGRR